MSKDNFDDWAFFCGDKDFYDMDGDGHLDWLEAGMMIADVDDEIKDVELGKNAHTYTSAPKVQRSSLFGLIMGLSIVFWIIGLAIDAGNGIANLGGIVGGIFFIAAIFAVHAVWKEAHKEK